VFPFSTLGFAHFISNPLETCSYSSPTARPTSLALSLFLFLPSVNQLGWRLRQLAALRHLNKPKCGTPEGGPLFLLLWFLVLAAQRCTKFSCFLLGSQSNTRKPPSSYLVEPIYCLIEYPFTEYTFLKLLNVPFSPVVTQWTYNAPLVTAPNS
jgi:hypothetical protein